MSVAGHAPIAIDLRHLRYFLVVFEELHFGKAAERLHIAQPPLSQAIRKLERELGVRLLERTSRAVRPTAAGQVFAEEAEKVVASFDFAVAEARRLADAGGRLRIGCIPHLPIEQLLRFLGALYEGGLDAHVDVAHLPFAEQMARLRNGDLDLAIVHQSGDDPDVETEPLYPGDQLALFLPSGHRLGGKRLLRPEDLHEEDLITIPRDANAGLRERLLGLIGSAGYRFSRHVDAEGSNACDLLLAVAAGRGVALGPSSLLEVSDASTVVIRRPIHPALSMPDTVLAWRADPPRELSEQLAAVREVARALRRGADAQPARVVAASSADRDGRDIGGL